MHALNDASLPTSPAGSFAVRWPMRWSRSGRVKLIVSAVGPPATVEVVVADSAGRNGIPQCPCPSADSGIAADS